MLKQPTFQSLQSVQVIAADHPRHAQVGRVVDVNETDLVDTDGEGNQVNLGAAVRVQFDQDWETETVPVAALRGL